MPRGGGGGRELREMAPSDVDEDEDNALASTAGYSMDPRARREQCTTRLSRNAREAMAKRLRGGVVGNEPECMGNRSRGRPNRDGRAGGVGTSKSFLKIWGPKFRRGVLGRVIRVCGGEDRRCVDTRIAKRLETIHPNPGPRRRGRRNAETNRAYQRRRQYRKRRKRREEKEEARRLEEERQIRTRQRRQEERSAKPVKIVTWNVQKMSLRENNRRRLRELVTFCVEKEWDVVMMTEVTSQDEGFFWLGEDEKKVAVIHGRKTAILLTGEWADAWRDQGSQRWLGNRTVATKVNHLRLVCGYQPLWNYGDVEMDNYRAEMDVQVQRTRANEWLIIGGDHNASIGKANERDVATGDVVGRYGLGQRNEAGRDLVRWCEELGLAWVNSFYMHNWRGTWCHPGRHTWHELDGFIMKKSHMGKLVQKVQTIHKDSYSDHRPKMMTLRANDVGQPKIRQEQRNRRPKIKWEALQDEGKKEAYKRNTEAKMQHIDKVNEIKWEKIATVMTKAAMETCGKKGKELATPWVAGREAQLVALRQAIAEAVQDVRVKKEQDDQRKDEQSKRELEEAVTNRKIKRRQHRITLRAWEREYWAAIIEEMEEAQRRGNYGEVYRTLRKLGQRGSSKAPPSVYFTPEEFRDHFSKVSQHVFEKDAESWEAVMRKIQDNHLQAEFQAAGEELEKTPSKEEIWKSVKEMKDKASGEDDVRISYVKYAAEPVQDYVIKTVQNMFEQDPEEWEEMLGSGLVIPLFKKGERKDRNNYRGVCLLQMGSRILARVLATRIRRWSEKVGLVDDNQQGFRSGRSTMDATQIMVRIQEEVLEKEKDKTAAHIDTSDTREDPGAVLLDITKAYPRVNRPAMWKILERAGMREKCLRTVRGIHEKTIYKVKGREECSSAWKANRGLREGCATSPALFNIYHAEVMRQAKEAREEACTSQRRRPGIEWMYIPGNALPPKSINKAMTSSDATSVFVTEALFADDTTVIGKREELLQNVKKIKEAMGKFEEKCHDGKEEWVYFGKDGTENVRMLGTWLGREEDVKERLARGNRAWWTMKKRLCKTTIPKKTQAKLIEACVESTMLFDCAARPWMKKEVKRIQQQMDRCYRYVWMDKKGGPGLRQMETKGVNMYDVRKELGVISVETKIAKRSLERIGHVLRMDNQRMTKKVILGWPKQEQIIPGRKSRKNTTITWWRMLLRHAGIDADTMEAMATNRQRWKEACREETKRREAKENARCKRQSQNPARDEDDTEEESTVFICDWTGCGKGFEKKTGLVQHQRIKHKRQELRFECDRCKRMFKQKSNLTNHRKICKGAPEPGQCPQCLKILSKSNIARHVKACTRRQERRPTSDPEENREILEDQDEVEEEDEQREDDLDIQSRQEENMCERPEVKSKVPKWPCCMCGKAVARGGLKCVTTQLWCHFGCGRVKYTDVRRWEDKDINEWSCPQHQLAASS